MNTEKRISRRQALKTLAAITGAVSLASLPNWEKPVIEVGALPAHAQTSTLTISNFTGEIPNINNCEASSGIGSEETLTFSYHDPTGMVNDSSIINNFSEFLPSGDSVNNSLSITDSNVTHTGNGYDGTITVTYCVVFLGDSQIRETISLTNGAGVTSNQLTITIDAPPGANSVESGGGHGYKQ